MTTVISIFGMTSIGPSCCPGLESSLTTECRLAISRLRRRRHGTIRQLAACGIGLLEARRWTSRFRRSREMKTSKPRETIGFLRQFLDGAPGRSMRVYMRERPRSISDIARSIHLEAVEELARWEQAARIRFYFTVWASPPSPFPGFRQRQARGT